MEVEDHLFLNSGLAVFLFKPVYPLLAKSKVVGFGVLIFPIVLESLKFLPSIVSFSVLFPVFVPLLKPRDFSLSAPKSPYSPPPTLLFARVPIGANLHPIARLAAPKIRELSHTEF